MPFNTEDTDLYRRDVKSRGGVMSIGEREALLKKYLPVPAKPSASRPQSYKAHTPSRHKRRIRPYIKAKIHLILYLLIQFIFGVYVRLRQMSNAIVHKFLAIRHYHHRTPAYIKKDTHSLSRLPDHLSVLLKYDPTDDDGSALETLIDEVAELSAWSAAAGIPLLSVYEKTGVLKSYMSAVQELVNQKLVLYFGSPPLTPRLRVYAPNLPTLSPAQSPRAELANGLNGHMLNGNDNVPQLNLLLLSASDGRDTLVDLTRTLAEMSQSSKLQPKDINSSLINTEINATTSIQERGWESPCFGALNGDSDSNQPLRKGNEKETAPSEPDLLIIFGPYVKLDGYPPWQVRLTEIYCVGDSGGDVSKGVSGRTRVEYQAFLRALWKFSGAQMRFGR